MNIRFKKVSISILCILISTSIVLADSKGKGKDKDKDKGYHSEDHGSGVSTSVGVYIFAGNDHDLIRNHFLVNQGGLPPGLAKRRGDLPPGLEKQLRSNGHLPPGLEKKLHPFPVELERRLPVLRPGLVRGMIGVNAVIMDKRTSVILDIFKVL
jgi:hypothetical protein